MSFQELLSSFVDPTIARKLARDHRRECARLERERRRTLKEIWRLRRSLLCAR